LSHDFTVERVEEGVVERLGMGFREERGGITASPSRQRRPARKSRR